MATNNEMRAWLESEKGEFFGGLKWRENPDLPFWMKKDNEDMERRNAIIDSILAALSGPGEEERKEMIEVMDGIAQGKYVWRFSPSIVLIFYKIRALILDHGALSGPSEEEREELVKWLADYAERYTGFMMSRPYMVIEPTEEDKKKWAEVKAIILGHAAGEGEKERE